VDGLAAQVEALTEAQARAEERVGRLEEALTRLAEAQGRTEEQVARLAEAQARTEERLGHIEAWLRGESGRREGERFEAEIIRRASRILGPGRGGSPAEAPGREWLDRVLAPILDGIEPETDPALSDLIWWREDGRVAVVEASLVIDPKDVYRARARAGTLSRAGLEALGVVVGKIWAPEPATWPGPWASPGTSRGKALRKR